MTRSQNNCLTKRKRGVEIWCTIDVGVHQ